MNQHINQYADKIQYPDNTQYTEKIAAKHRRKRIWQRVVGVLACLTVFCTTYALVLPAVTMTDEFFCGYEEHPEHTEDCYGLVLTCGYAEDTGSDNGENITAEAAAEANEGAHEHTEACYAESEKLICTANEHTHDESCYEISSELVCDEEHEHTDDCYAENETLVCTANEHTHDDSCYEIANELVCSAAEEDDFLANGDDIDNAAAEPHEHTEACYERGLICDKPLHTHTAECLIDRNVDTENEDIWERSVESAVLTGNWNEDVLAIAKTQLGYTESEQNYRLSADGTARYGYSRYAAWYFGEDDPYAEWNAAFAAFCIRYAGLPEEFPINGDVGAWSAALTQQGLLAETSEYTPVSGDLAFLDTSGRATADKVGIVLSADESSVRVILGDYQDAVSEESFSLDEVLGYGSVQNAYRVYTGEELEELAEIALYSDPAAVAPDYIGSIDTANAWQIVAEEYNGNAKSAKIGADVDNDGVAEVLVQKNVVPTANENEFLVYLSISKQMSWDTLLAQSTLGLTTQGKWKESDVGTVVNESQIGGNKTNYLLPGKGSNRNYSATITLTKNGQTVHTFTGWYNGTTPNASRCTGYIILNGLSSKAIIASVAVNLHNDGGGSGGTLKYTIDLDKMSNHNISYAIDEISLDKVTDQLGTGIIYDGVAACDGTAVESEGTITWQIKENENVEGVNYQDPTTGYVENVAQLVYRVRLDVTQEGFYSCADNMDSTPADPESYAVNKSAVLNYKMGEKSYEQYFPVPYVRGLNYNVAFSKKGDDGNYLSGAVFELYESDGVTPVKRDGEPYTLTTDASVSVNRFSDLPCGTYILRESRAAPGYSAPEQAEWEITLNYTTNAAQLSQDAGDERNMRYSGKDVEGVWTIINTKSPFAYDILLKKQNKAGEALAGVLFSLTPDEEGSWQNCATDENGQYLFSGDFGVNISYELSETAPIEGYYRLPDGIRFKVQEDQTTGEYVPVLENAEALNDLVSLKLKESDGSGKYVLEVTVVNESGYILPETGGRGTLPFTLGGFAMIFSGVAIYFYRSKRRFE